MECKRCGGTGDDVQLPATVTSTLEELIDCLCYTSECTDCKGTGQLNYENYSNPKT